MRLLSDLSRMVVGCALVCALVLGACGDDAAGPGTTGVIEGKATLSGATDHGGIFVSLDQAGGTATTAPDGSYRISDVPPGTYVVSASRGGYRTASSDPVQARAGQVITAPELVLQPVQASLSGLARLEGQTDHSGIALTLAGTDKETETVADGSYSFANVSPGTYVVQASRPGFDSATSPPVTVPAEGGDLTVPALLLEMARGNLEGVATLEGESEHGGILVVLQGTSHATLTGPTGGYAFSGVPAGQYTVVASYPSFASATATDQAVVGDETTQVPALVLATNPGTVTGHVALEGGGDPTGTTVTLMGTGITSVAGADGAFTLASVPTGTYVVQATLAGFDPALSAPFVLAPGGTFDVGTLTLSVARGSLTGTATLYGQTDHSGILVSLQGTSFATLTGPTGAFAFNNVAVGQYTVVATKTGFAQASVTDQAVVANQTTAVPALVLATNPGTVTGHVALEGGGDPTGTTVTLMGTGITAVAGADGAFTLASVPTGTYVVQATLAGFDPALSAPFVLAPGGTFDVGTLTLPLARGSLSGTAALDGQTDHSGILVSLQGTSFATLTGPTGAFAFNGVAVGQYTVVATKTGFAQASVTDQAVVANQTTAVPALVLGTNPGTVTGHVALEGGGDPTGTTVTLMGTGITSVVGSDGAFTLAIVPTGTYVVQATLAGFDPAQSAPFVLAPGGTFDVGTLTLPLARGSLAGTATLDGQTDHSGILVSVMGTGYAAMTGANGSWSILGVPAGNYTIRASHSGYEDSSATDQQVSAGQNTTVPNITLYVRTSSISGTVTLESTTDHSGVSIIATAAWNPALTHSASTNMAGSYTISGVEPGMWHMVASKTDYQSATQENVFVQADYPTVGVDFLLEYQPAGTPSDLVYVSGGSNQSDPNQTGVVGTTLGAPFVVKVIDSYGFPISGTQVYFEVIDAKSGGQMVNPMFVLTNASGEASNTYILGRTVGLNHVRASATYVPGQFVDFLAVGEPDVPDAVLPQHGDFQTATVGATLATALGVLVRDQYGNAVPGATCSFVPSAGSASPPLVAADSLGYAQSSWTLGTTMGPQTLTVTCGTATYVFTATAQHDLAATIVKVSGDNQTGINSTTLANPLVVEVRDQYGNPVSGAEVSFAMTTGSGILAPAAPQTTGPSGRAQVSLTLSSLGAVQTTASVAGLTPAVFSATSIAGTPSVLVIVSGGVQQGVVATTLAAPFVVRLNDNYGNPVEGATLQFAPGALGGTLGSASPPSAVTGADGQASTTLTLGTLAGAAAQWVDVTVDGFHTVTLRIFADAEPDAPASITIVSGDNQVAAYGQQLAVPLVVYLEDQFGNPAWNYQVPWTSTTDGTVTPNPSPVNASGLATVTATLGSTPGMPAQDFTATAGTVQATFHATATGHYIDWIDPWKVWEGYPEMDTADPTSIEVQVTIHGAGFDSGAVVVLHPGTAEEEVMTPSSVVAIEIVVLVTADHFTAMGDIPVSVANPGDDRCAPVSVMVGHVLSDTGQEQCTQSSGFTWSWVDCATVGPSDPNYGQDGHYSRPVHAETIPQGQFDVRMIGGDRVVRDLETGLMWQGCPAGMSGENCETGSASTMSWTAALAYCEGLSWAGSDDWKLPDLNELKSIWPMQGAFPGTPSTWFWFWSSSSYHTPDGAWLVSFGAGDVSQAAKGATHYARCVRGRVGP